HPGHLSGLAADQRAAVGGASPGYTRNDLYGDVGLKLPGSKVIEKEKRFRTLYRDVIHAVVHKVLTDCLMASRGECDFQLGAYAIDGTHQHGLTHLGRSRKRETAAERAYVRKNTLCKRAASHFADR